MSIGSYMLTCTVILLTPGPTNTLLAASGAAFGFRRAAALPLAEAAGYAIAIGAYLAAAHLLGEVPLAMPALKAIAAAWLLLSAVKLWQNRVAIDAGAVAAAYRQIFFTTILNPKAMLVATIVIPGMMSERPATALFVYIALSTLAGAAWLTMGSALPSNMRPHAYKAAALVLGAFSIAAATSSIHG